MKRYMADFETATWFKDKTHVWAWGFCDIENVDLIKDEDIEVEGILEYGNSIECFIEFCKKEKNPIIYFHNEKFDGEFIIWHLLNLGYEWVKSKDDVKENTFTTLINSFGQFYSIVIYFSKGNKDYKKVTIYDSLKIIPFKVAEMPEKFGLEENKLQIDYKEVREIGHALTLKEKKYLKHDLVIVAKALKELFDEGLTKMTQGSNAMNDFKKLVSKSKFNHYFPTLDLELYEDIKKSYKGGFTYLNPQYKEKDIENITAIDVNSMYPRSYVRLSASF